MNVESLKKDRCGKFSCFPGINISAKECLKFMFPTFLLVCFVCLKEITLQTRKNVFCFTLTALFVRELIKF